MEVLPAFVVVAAAMVWLWLRDSGKQVTSDEPQREGADAPSPRAAEGHSGHIRLAWRDRARAPEASGLDVLDPNTGQPIDERDTRLDSQPFEVVDVVDVDPAAVRRGDVAPGVVLLVQRPDAPAGADVEFRTADTGERIGRLTPQQAPRVATLMDQGRRLESMVVRHQPRQSPAGLQALIAERGVLPPVPAEPDTPDRG